MRACRRERGQDALAPRARRRCRVRSCAGFASSQETRLAAVGKGRAPSLQPATCSRRGPWGGRHLAFPRAARRVPAGVHRSKKGKHACRRAGKARCLPPQGPSTRKEVRQPARRLRRRNAAPGVCERPWAGSSQACRGRRACIHQTGRDACVSGASPLQAHSCGDLASSQETRLSAAGKAEHLPSNPPPSLASRTLGGKASCLPWRRQAPSGRRPPQQKESTPVGVPGRKTGRDRQENAPCGAMEGETPSLRGPVRQQVLQGAASSLSATTGPRREGILPSLAPSGAFPVGRAALARAREGRMPSLRGRILRCWQPVELPSAWTGLKEGGRPALQRARKGAQGRRGSARKRALRRWRAGRPPSEGPLSPSSPRSGFLPLDNDGPFGGKAFCLP